ncbi:PAS-domain containing protein [Roseateles sp. GG27B]
MIEPPAPPQFSPSSPSQRHEALQAALNLIDQGFTLMDSNLSLVAWNTTFLRLLDFPAEMGFVGASFESFIRFNALRGDYGSDADPQGYIDTRMAAARAFHVHEFERTRPDGTVLRVRGVPVPEHGFMTIYSDVTAEKRAESQVREHNTLLETHVAERTAELRRSEAQMRLITDSIPALVAYSDRDRIYRYINRGYQDWFGLDPAQPERVSAKEFLGAATFAGIRPQVQRAFAGEAVTFEYVIARIDGSRVTARTTLIPEISADGSVAGCFELTFDISAEKRAQEILAQTQKLELLGQLTGGLAHDFNNILTVIIGNLSALAEARAGDAAVAEFVAPAVDAARRGAELIKALQSFSRKQPLQAQAVDIAPLIASVVALVRRSLPDSLQLDVRIGIDNHDSHDSHDSHDNAALWAWVDADQLQSTLINLIFNARDAVPAQGRIGLQASAAWLDAPAAAALQVEPGDYIRLDLSDNGKGMDAATLARVFEPFFTTKQPGLGTSWGCRWCKRLSASRAERSVSTANWARAAVWRCGCRPVRWPLICCCRTRKPGRYDLRRGWRCWSRTNPKCASWCGPCCWSWALP